MGVRIFISSLILALIILLPIARKCEIRKKVAIIGSLVIGSLTGIATIILNYKGIGYPLLMELGFIVLFTGIIGLYRFYRDPNRIPPKTENVILAPADGFIKYIKLIKSEILLQKSFSDFNDALDIERSWIIGITMTYLDVHVNRSPVDGRVILVKHIPGKFLSLKKEEAPSENKRAILVIDHGCFKIGLTLIASRIVRKILVWIKEGAEVKAGQRIGKIVFGSQTDIIIPLLTDLQINVKEGEQVYAGLTILAEYK